MTKPRTHGFTRRRLWDRPAPTGQSGFTLVELLSVLVILAILLSIALPAVTNLSKANAVSSAARQISNTLNLARQFAITHRVRTRVVFPFYLTTTVSTLAPEYLSYAVMTNDANAIPPTWTYVTKWEHLPTGAIFLNNALVGSLPNRGALDDNSSLPQDLLPFPYPNSSHTTLAYIEFGPTGAASQTGTLTIKSGFINNTGTPTTTSPYNSVTNVVDNIVGHIQLIHP
jgi:prepilin-type N-terminal cleavage/methylation domain-containing protein